MARVTLKTIDDEVYHASIILAYGGSHGELRKALRKKKKKLDPSIEEEDWSGTAGCMLHIADEEGTDFVLWVSEPTDICTLVHDLGHLVFDIFESRGVTLDKENNEPYTYYMEYLLAKIMKALKLKVVKGGK